MPHATHASSVNPVPLCNTPRALPPEVELLGIALDGVLPVAHQACLVQVVDQRPAGIRLRQGAHTTGWLSTSQLMVEVGELGKLDGHVLLYMPRWLVESAKLTALEPLELERAQRHLAQRADGRVELARDQRAHQLGAQGSLRDPALAVHTIYGVAGRIEREQDAKRGEAISKAPEEQDGAQDSARVYALALAEHMAELMEQRRFEDVVRACHEWERQMDAASLAPLTRQALVQVLARASHAAQQAMQSKPYRSAMR